MSERGNEMIYGLVGKSGAGKTTAANILSEFGVFAIDCDKVAAAILAENEDVKERLAEAFGAEVLIDGIIQKKLLAERAFADKDSLEKLNSITHPPILKKLSELAKGKEKVLLDAPTLFESGANRLCDKIIAVIAADELCVERLKSREGLSEESAKIRLSMQKDEKYLRSQSDIIIVNDGDEEEFRRRIEDVAKVL